MNETMRDLDLLMEQAALHVHNGSIQEALELYRRAASANSPRRAEALLALAQCSTGLQLFEASNEILHQLLSMSERRVPALKLMADNYEGLKEVEQALQTYREIAQLAPGNFGLRFKKANLLASLERHAEAMEDYSAVLRVKEFSDAHYNMGNSLVALNRIAEAVVAFQAAVRLKPSSIEALTNLANAQIEIGALKEARDNLEMALKLHQRHPQVRRNLANNLLYDGLSMRALELYEDRFGVEPFKGMPKYGLPLLGASPIEGKRILIQWEQAFGDIIQMVRFVPAMSQGRRHALGSFLSLCVRSSRAHFRASQSPGPMNLELAHTTFACPTRASHSR